MKIVLQPNVSISADEFSQAAVDKLFPDSNLLVGQDYKVEIEYETNDETEETLPGAFYIIPCSNKAISFFVKHALKLEESNLPLKAKTLPKKK